MNNPHIIAPRPDDKSIVRADFQAEWWRRLEDKWNPPYKIENIHFVYDPHWRERWVSVQHTGDVAREINRIVLEPYRIVVGSAENVVFWAVFDFLDRRPPTRPTSLPPHVAYDRKHQPV